MKIRDNFLLREVAGNRIVVPVGEAADRFHGMLKLNETGAYLWHLLESPTDEAALMAAMLRDYDIDQETAQRDLQTFLNTLRKAGLLEEE